MNRMIQIAYTVFSSEDKHIIRDKVWRTILYTPQEKPKLIIFNSSIQDTLSKLRNDA